SLLSGKALGETLTRLTGQDDYAPAVLGSLALLIAIRFLFGMGEAGAYPNITRALHNWLPLTERAFGQGAVWMAGRLMVGLTPFIWALLTEGLRQADDGGHHVAPLLTWRSAFWAFGVLGTLWCVAFALWFRNRPEEKPAVNLTELDLIRGGRTDREAVHA